MWKVIVCDGDATEREQLIGLIRQCLQGKEAQVTGCTDWPELDDMVKPVLPDAVIVAQDGVEGLNTITSARNLVRRILWFSDMDFRVQAYRLCVPFFCRKPVSRQKMERAISRLINTSPKTGKS
ncbi:hypothetical protein SAMN05216405_2421 [Lachnospiraceae bacterium NLAE-zl-G231]|nr:hypothetical protein SAMN05216405_2421 [Lachnospiraceae bacterium NLAE-zl-G231]